MKNLSFYCQPSTLVAMESASEEAQCIILSQFSQTKEAQRKRDGTWVSEVDREAEKILCRSLKKHFPEVPFLGEEGDHDHWDMILNTKGPLWVVDPLDGTSNYLHQCPFFCTSIALVYNQRPIAALVHYPLRHEKYMALLGHGTQLRHQGYPSLGYPDPQSYQNHPEGHQDHPGPQENKNLQNLRLSDGRDKEWCEALISMEFFPLKKRASERLQHLGRFFMSRSQGIRNMGCAAYALALTAKGAFDVFYAESLLPWDKAAGILLVEEAGGEVLVPKEKEAGTKKEEQSEEASKLLTGPILAGKKNLVQKSMELLQE